MARQPAVSEQNKPATKAAAIRQAFGDLGGLEAETAEVVAHIKKTWNMDVRRPEVSQYRSNARAKLKQQGQAAAATAPAGKTAAAAARPAAQQGLTADEITKLAALVHRHGAETIQQLAAAIAGNV